MLTEIRVPMPAARVGGAYLKLERKIGDFASVGVAVHIVLEGGDRIAEAGIGLCAVGSQSLKATAAELALAGQVPDDSVITAAARLAAGAAEPKSDLRGSADYKRDVVRVFVERGLRRALGRARGETA